MAFRKTSFASIATDFHSKESSLICIGQKGGRETYGTFITFGQKGGERVIIGDCWKSIDM